MERILRNRSYYADSVASRGVRRAPQITQLRYSVTESSDNVVEDATVFSELATLTSRTFNHKTAMDVLQTIRRSESFTILPVGEGVFAAVCDEFERYNDQQISFVDHTSAVLAREYDIDHIFAFDQDLTTLGLTRVPADIHFPE